MSVQNDIVIVSIGPVQSFISQARRTHDLWMSSRLLSYLAQQGADSAVAQHAQMIYPVKLNDKWPSSVPNHLVFTVTNGSNVARNVEKTIRTAWQNLAATVRDAYLGAKLGAVTSWLDAWQAQVDSWLEVYWIAVPEKAGLENAHRAMAARKLLRHFSTHGEPGEKCSLCGERQALSPAPGQRETRLFWQGSGRDREPEGVRLRVRNPALLSKGEWLCAVCATKRFVHEVTVPGWEKVSVKIGGREEVEARFPSTNSIASLTFRVNVLKKWDEHIPDSPDTLGALATEYVKTLEKLVGPQVLFTKEGVPNPERYPYLQEQGLYDYLRGIADRKRFLSIDGDYFYDELLTPKRMEEYFGIVLTSGQLQGASDKLAVLLKGASLLEIARPQRYLAVLSIDGDKMGDRARDAAKDKRSSLFSEKVAEFARVWVPQIVQEKYPGRLVYSGGDDVLALLPVEVVLDVANQLRKEFIEHMKTAGFSRISVSAGIALVHHTHPLGWAIDAAREAARTAKQTFGRPAMVVDFIRRSGERRQMGCGWTEQTSVLEAVLAFQDAFATNVVSSKLPYELSDMAFVMDPVTPEMRASSGKASEEEVRRLTIRDIAPNQNLPRDKREALAKPFLDNHLYPMHNRLASWRRVAEWLHLARFLAQGGES